MLVKRLDDLVTEIAKTKFNGMPYGCLVTEAGEARWRGYERVEPVATGKFKDGIPVCHFAWHLSAEVKADTIQYFALYDAKSGGRCLGMCALLSSHPDMHVGDNLSVFCPIGL